MMTEAKKQACDILDAVAGVAYELHEFEKLLKQDNVSAPVEVWECLDRLAGQVYGLRTYVNAYDIFKDVTTEDTIELLKLKANLL